jgi:hypothetical protein
MAKKVPDPKAAERLWKRRLFDRWLVEEQTIDRYERLADRHLKGRMNTNDLYFLYSNLCSLLESSTRDLVRLCVDGGLLPFEQLPPDLRRPNINLDMIAGLRQRRYTIGDIVSLSFNISSVSQIDAIANSLFGEGAIKGAYERIFHVTPDQTEDSTQPSYYLFVFGENVFSKRHELVHEFSETMFSPQNQDEWKRHEVENDIKWGIRLLRCL